MNKQRKVVITTTYNEMGIIIDTKAEEVAQPNLQPTCNKLATDTISRQAALDALNHELRCGAVIDQCGLEAAYEVIEALPPAEPDRKTGWWLIREGISDAQCSECGMYFNDVYDMENSDAFCRHCGTKMEGLKVVKNE